MKKFRINRVTVSKEHVALKYKGRGIVIVSYVPSSTRCRWFFLVSRNQALVSMTESVAFRRYVRKKTKRIRALVDIRLFPLVHLTKKSLGIRMGNGRGSKVYSSVLPMLCGQIIVGLRGLTWPKAAKIEDRYKKKLSVFFKLRYFSVSANMSFFSKHYLNQENVELKGCRGFRQRNYGKFELDMLDSFEKIPEVVSKE